MFYSRKIICIGLALLFFACKANESKAPAPDCDKLKSGNYEYRSKIGLGRIRIQRSDSLQTETDSKTGTGMNFRVTWPSPCEYQMKFLSFTGKVDEMDFDIEKIPLVRSKIIKVTPNYYITRSVMSGRSGEFVDTILIIK